MPSTLPVDAVELLEILPGRGYWTENNVRHTKVAPALIIALPVNGRYTVRYPDGTVTVDPGGAWFAATGTLLVIDHHQSPPGEPMVAEWVHLQAVVHGVLDLGRLLELPHAASGASVAGLQTVITELLSLHNPAPLSTEWFRRTQLGWQLLSSLVRIAPLSAAGAERLQGAAALAGLRGWLRERLADPLTVDDLAAAAHCSSPTLFRNCRRSLGCTPMQWLKDLRLEQGRRRLLAGDGVAVAAAASGFATPFHFSREFHRKYRLAPGEYRERARSWDGSPTE